jgi:4-amino-4-deoxy-L-arabinose transferase-like glycosyltransferase
LVPWLTSLVYRAFGHRPFAAILFQCAIGAMVPLLLAGFGGAVFGGTVGRIAGWLAALQPLLVFFAGRLIPETTFTAVLLLALAASASWVKTPRPGRALGAGITWGLAALTRPTALLLPAVVAAWGWVPLGLTVPARERLRQVALLLLGFMLIVGPWTLRNALVLHAFVPVTTGGGLALLDGNNLEVLRDPRLHGGAIRSSLLEPYASESRGLGEPQADAVARRHAWRFLSTHVRDWPAMAAAKLRHFWRLTAEGGGTPAWPRQHPALARVLGVFDPVLVWSLLTWPFAAWGLARTLRGPRRLYQGLGFIVVLYFTVLAVVFWGAPRMRVPIEPLLVLFTAVGFDDARRRVRMRAHALRVIAGRR